MSMKNIIQAIKRNKRFLISTHANPDPDALCSELALSLFLRALGKHVAIINNEAVPKRFHFLSGARGIKECSKVKKLRYDVAIIVDCGDLNRIGRVKRMIQDEKLMINIDHHVTNDRFGDLNLVQPKASSTAEVLYELFSTTRVLMTKAMAAHLYAGIMTDTGSFHYENTTARTHAIVADLMKHKVSPSALYAQLYETISPVDLKNFTKTISSFELLFNKKVACIKLTKKILSKYSEDFDLRDAIFKFLRTMKKTKVFVILTEASSKVTRVNLRSSSSFDVAKLAGTFGGGGHIRASGCVVHKNMAQTRAEVLKRIRKAL